MLQRSLPLLTFALAWALPATASPIAGPGPNSLHAQAAFNSIPKLLRPEPLSGHPDHGSHDHWLPPSELAGQLSIHERYDGHEVWRVDWHGLGETAKEEILALLEVGRRLAAIRDHKY